jgi:alpha-glucosidase
MQRRTVLRKSISITLVFVVCQLVEAHAQTSLPQADWQTLGDVSSFEKRDDGIEIHAQRGNVRITAVSQTTVRVRYSFQNESQQLTSFAVLPQAFQNNDPKLEIADAADHISLQTGSLTVRVYKSPLRIAFLQPSGALISEDLPSLPVMFDGSGFKVWKTMPEDEHYFGLGDKTGPMDHRDLAFTMWNTDAFGWQESTDPLYKDIPFIFALRDGASYGIFLDNTYRSSFEFGKEQAGSYSFGADGGGLDYYFFYGPQPKRVIEQFTELVGRTPLPPLFALGYQQCRYSYYPESQVRRIATEFRKRKIPADVIYLDIDYQKNNRPFTVDTERFPNFQGMIRDLRAEGFKVVAITDLHIADLPGYRPYDEGMKSDYFVKNPDGSVYVGKVWPGDSVFPDFTREQVRRWWGTLYTDFVNDGLRGFWNDMNEPAVFRYPSKTMPLDVVHSVEGRHADHREIHNVFGMENARSTYEGLLRLQPNLRPFVLTRAAFAGTQRYAATWTGDNSATWNHMRLSIPQLLNLGLSGYAFVGADIGGFNGSPTPELLTRWMELGAFNPIYRNHAAKETRFREPWVDGPEHEAIRRRYIETRYRLLPYIYTSMEETSRTGVPLMRPMFMEFPGQSNLALNDREFMFGEELLIAPKVWDFVGKYSVSLPAGDWYEFWTGAKVAGGKEIELNPALDALPVFVKSGSIIPEQPVVQNVDETPRGPLILEVYPGPQCHGTLYSDDGNTFAYQNGETLRVEFTCNAATDHVDVDISAAQGPFQPWFHEVQFQIHGVGRNVAKVVADSHNVTGWKLQSGVLILPPLSWGKTGLHVSAQFSIK